MKAQNSSAKSDQLYLKNSIMEDLTNKKLELPNINDDIFINPEVMLLIYSKVYLSTAHLALTKR